MQLSMNRRPAFHRSGERGAALIATIAVLALLSVFLTVGLRFLRLEDDFDRRVETRRQMESVIDSIAAHVQRERRLPCPADPALAAPAFGTESRPGANAGCAAINGQFTGIVPFQTLFIDESAVRDGWGRLFTYAVSPVFGDTRNPAADANIFYICRKSDWVNTLLPDPPPNPLPIPGTPRNENPLKARLCCPGAGLHPPGTDLEILDENGTPYNLRADQGPPPAAGTPQRTTGAVAGGFNNVDSLAGEPINANLINQENIVAFAITLISHGPNGHGAFLGDGTATQFLLGGVISAAETENADRDNVFIDRPAVIVDGSNNYFDDIVLWRSQFSLYNELNNATCARPWR